MTPTAHEYHAPATVQDALDLLQQHGDDAKVLAGGHSLVPLIKLRLADPAVLVDITRIPELRGIRREDGAVTIGATTTHAAIEFSDELKASLPILPAAATLIGDPMVRNRGTFGGALAHADPAADWPAMALALDAEMTVLSPAGERTVPAAEFFVDLLTSAVEPGELLTRISIPVPRCRVGMAYRKFAHPASGYAVTGVAAVLALDETGACRDCRVAVTGAAAVPSRAAETEAALRGRPLTEQTIAEAAEQAGAGLDFLGDIYASEEYREHLVRTYARRTLRAALAAARNDGPADAEKS